MKVIIPLAVIAFCVCEAVVPSINKEAELKVHKEKRQSCLDYLKDGCTKNGFYAIVINGQKLTVYCDFKSEPGMAWTLVMSWSYLYKNLPAFRSQPFRVNVPVNEKNPNVDIYRLGLVNTRALQSQSTHWRATCSFQYIGDSRTLYRDYVRGKFAHFNIVDFLGHGHCKLVEYINIRGIAGYHTTAKFWQVLNAYTLHIDSPSTGCGFFAGAGAVPSEDNFGFYGSTANKKFRCTNNPGATTSWWFGGYV